MFLHQNTIIHYDYNLQAPMVGGVKRKPHQGLLEQGPAATEEAASLAER